MDFSKIQLTAIAVAVSAATGVLPTTYQVAHAQTNNCYLDDRGRIVTRRRPGYTRVDCPQTNQTPENQPTTTPTPTSTTKPTTQPTTAPPTPQPTEPYEPIESGATDVFFIETKPDATQTAKPQTQTDSNQTDSNDSQPIQSPSETGLFQLPSRRNNETVVTSDGTSATVEDLKAPDNKISLIPRPTLEDYQPSIPVPDRFKVVDNLGTLTTGKPDGFKGSLLDPYNRNKIKGDTPLGIGDDWFFNVLAISDTVLETREVPTPVGSSSSGSSGDLDVFGGSSQSVFSQTFATEFVYYKGDTVFKPPDYEYRFTPAINFNFANLDPIQGVNADPRDGDTRTDGHFGVQALFFDKHLRNVSDRYDFDSFRIGIQPFSSDFRGFLFQDNQFGARLFGNRNNNFFQYNLAWFRRIEKDTNSGLNDLGQGLRDDDVFIANIYRQDFPVLGFVSQASVIYNRNRENDEFHFDQNDFIQRPSSLGREVPREYDVVYLGLNGDGHFDRLNVTTSAYVALGTETPGVFTDDSVDISAFFGAAELSIDYDWIRPRVSLLFGSGDNDPLDDKATGFDAIFENPQFAGGDTSYWNRQAVPLVGGGRVTLSARNAILNSLRSSKEEGQSNFTNPGLLLAGVGVDMDILPELRFSANLNSLHFATTEVLELARNQADIDTHIGLDFSLSLTYRPLNSQNIVFRGSYANLIPGSGFDALFPSENSGYFLFNATLNY